MRLYVKNSLILTRDTAQKIDIYDNHESPFVIDNTAVVNGFAKEMTIPGVPSPSYQRVSFDGITPKFLYIEASATVTIRLNSADGTSGTEIPITPVATPASAGVFMLHGTLAVGMDLWIKNPSSNAASTVLVVYAG